MIDKYNNQKGALMFLSALLLPLVMAMAGMVIDYGNIYWHKSVLQNSADASALGGAKYGTQTARFQKKDADEKMLALKRSNESNRHPLRTFCAYETRETSLIISRSF